MGRTRVSIALLAVGLLATGWTAPRALTPGSPAVNVYEGAAAGHLSAAVRGMPPRVYVPNSLSNTVDVIDARTNRIVRRIAVGAMPHHVTPSWDMKTLYVDSTAGNTLLPLDPRTGRPRGAPRPVADPYNLYFTPDGRYAIVVAERDRRLDFRDARTFRLHRALRLNCPGVDHLDFSGDGSYAVASCEFGRRLVKVDVQRERVVGSVALPPPAAPQDVRVAPNGKLFYVADMWANGLWLVDGDRFRVVGFIHTGRGAHGLFPSRDGRFLYATNRGAGSISVVSFARRKVVRTWRIPGGGSPDMGGVSADGRVLWLSGRWNGVVYALRTSDGKLLARIRVGAGPHGLCVWPQPGTYSLGHTGITR
jgi:YVTN family beta-propeller protein